jgi:hypothetical protein
MTPTEKQPPYRVYVLRSWQERTPSAGTPAVWRFSLEDPTTRQRRGFADLAALTNFLAAEMEGSSSRDFEERNNGCVISPR